MSNSHSMFANSSYPQSRFRIHHQTVGTTCVQFCLISPVPGSGRGKEATLNKSLLGGKWVTFKFHLKKKKEKESTKANGMLDLCLLGCLCLKETETLDFYTSMPEVSQVPKGPVLMCKIYFLSTPGILCTPNSAPPICFRGFCWLLVNNFMIHILHRLIKL